MSTSAVDRVCQLTVQQCKMVCNVFFICCSSAVVDVSVGGSECGWRWSSFSAMCSVWSTWSFLCIQKSELLFC